MVTTVNLRQSLEARTYKRQDCITFRKTAEKFGGLSNMAGGYPLNVNGVEILTSEALYQACRFPHFPEIQRQIIAERSPMTAKMRSRAYTDHSRSDWESARIRIMRWCLQVKLVQNWDKFSTLLLATQDLPIVEDSRKDDFWGAKPKNEELLIGVNILGRLLMELREKIKNQEIFAETIIDPPNISDFLLYGRKINPISKNGEYALDKMLILAPNPFNTNPDHPITEISDLKFDQYDSLQYVLPQIVKVLQNNERTDQELAELFKVNKTQMRDWLKRAVQSRQIKKLSKPVRYIAESQLRLIRC
jgi:ribA/ribD-fused uncharacterized protein